MIESGTILAIAIFAIVPGYLYRQVRSHFAPLKPPEEHSALIGYIATSSWVLAVCWPVLALLGVDPLDTLHQVGQQPGLTIVRDHLVPWFATLFVAPALLAVIATLIVQHRWASRILRWIGIEVLDRSSTWRVGFAIAACRPGTLARIKLKDGKEVIGSFSDAARVSHDDRDVFLDQVYGMQNQRLVPLPTSRGVLLAGDSIEYVSFIQAPQESSHAAGP